MVKVTTLAILRQYAAGVVERAECHGPNVNVIVYTLLGYLIANLAVDRIEVRGSEGAIGNVLWCRYGGQRFAFSYDHKNGGSIVLRRSTTQGPLIGRFTNRSGVDDFKRAFEGSAVSTNTRAPQAQARQAHL